MAALLRFMKLLSDGLGSRMGSCERAGRTCAHLHMHTARRVVGDPLKRHAQDVLAGKQWRSCLSRNDQLMIKEWRQTWR